MNPFAHFEDQFGHLQLSDNDAALHVFLAGWNSAMMEMMQRVNKMPFGDDTRASFAVYFQSQMVNVDAIEKPAQQSAKRVEPVAVVSGYYGGQCVILPIDPARIFNSNTALYTTPPPCPTCEALARTVMLDQTSHDAQRKPLTITEESAWDLARYVYARSNPHESPQILLSAMEIKQIIEAAHGIKGDA
jgi:hypothetical protein